MRESSESPAPSALDVEVADVCHFKHYLLCVKLAHIIVIHAFIVTGQYWSVQHYLRHSKGHYNSR